MKRQKNNSAKSARSSLHHRKRKGHHQRRSNNFHKVYLPYMPLVISIIASILISGWQPGGHTLAYATNTSINGLLVATNDERNNAGQKSLTLNNKLISAAQAKANDMASRNYWSHNTPEGQEPWVFVEDAGYKYIKAGENLAYGFLDSNSTVDGWMNSPSHKANLLDSSFSEVGFGFSNSEDYNKSGPETVVVAMYGRPQVLASQAQPTNPSNESYNAEASAKEPELKVAISEGSENDNSIGFNSNSPGLEPVTAQISRIEVLTSGQAPWATFAVGMVVGLSLMAILMKHGLAIRRLIASSEEFVLHHPLFDSTVIGMLIVGVTLLQTTGFIK